MGKTGAYGEPPLCTKRTLKINESSNGMWGAFQSSFLTSSNPRETCSASTFLSAIRPAVSSSDSKASGLISSVAFIHPGTAAEGVLCPLATHSYSPLWLQLRIPIQTCLSDQRGGGGSQLSEALEQIVGNSCVRSRQQLVTRYCFLVALVPPFQTAARKGIKSPPQGSIGFEKSVRKAKM